MIDANEVTRMIRAIEAEIEAAEKFPKRKRAFTEGYIAGLRTAILVLTNKKRSMELPY